MGTEQTPGSGRPRVWLVAIVIAVGVVLVALVATMLVRSSSGSPQSGDQPTADPSSLTPASYASVADMVSQDPFFVAHRGGSAQWPEMSLLAYRNAAEWGVGALEVSVARSKDGVYFGLHDKTLDRTSQVAGDIDPATLTWDEITTSYRNKLNSTTTQGEPYTRVTEIFEEFASTHVIFVDTKYIGDPGQRAELVELMLAAAPADHWVLKGYYDNISLTSLARDNEIASWGYYYVRDLSELAATVGSWDMLGLEIAASKEQFAAVLKEGKPVIAFFVSDSSSLSEAESKGAQGMMLTDAHAVFGTPRLAQ